MIEAMTRIAPRKSAFVGRSPQREPADEHGDDRIDERICRNQSLRNLIEQPNIGRKRHDGAGKVR